MALSVIIFIGWVFMPIVGFVIFVLWIIGLIYAINETKKPIPIIGQFAEKYLKF